MSTTLVRCLSFHSRASGSPMPSNVHWVLNPRKWFGAIAHAAHKRDENSRINDSAPTPVSLTMNHSVPTTGNLSLLLARKNKTKVTPAPMKPSKNPADAAASFKHYELPAVRKRSETNSSLLSLSPSKLFYRRNPMTLAPPSIHSTGRNAAPSHEHKSTHSDRQKITAVVHDNSEYVFSPSVLCTFPNLNQGRRRNERTEVELPPAARPLLVDDPPHFSDNPILRHSPSSMDGTNELSTSSSSSTSGIYTDERPESKHHRASNDRRSTVEVRSIESRTLSRTCLYDEHVRLSRSDRRLSVFSHKSTDFTSFDHSQQSTRSLAASQRSERALRNDGYITKSHTRPSAAGIVKKIEKRFPPDRLPGITLPQKSTSMRASNDSHRLYRRRRPRSLAEHAYPDDWLRPASNEDSYANLPRTSSTQQFNHYSSDSLRAMVDTCLRPKISSRNVRQYAETNEERTEPTIDDLAGKLLSSIDCSIYARYERSY